MSKAPNLYDVWTDGSYNHTHHVGGAGWLIRHQDTEKENLKPLKDVPKEARPHGSDAAEILAVDGALGEIPDGSTVRIRLDCQNVLDWLKGGKITTKSKSEIGLLRDAFNDAMEDIGRMKSVEFIKVGGTSNAELKRVNDLARKATNMARHGK